MKKELEIISSLCSHIRISMYIHGFHIYQEQCSLIIAKKKYMQIQDCYTVTICKLVETMCSGILQLLITRCKTVYCICKHKCFIGKICSYWSKFSTRKNCIA